MDGRSAGVGPAGSAHSPSGQRTSLGLFLKDRRQRVDLVPRPEELVRRPFRRARPTGLRSFEAAMRAGIDPGYYARLEQGRATSPSPEVLDAVASALELSEAETQHLFELATRLRRRPHPSAPDPVPAGALEVVGQLGDAPAYLMDRHWDLVHWNGGMVAVFGDPMGLEPRQRNVVWMMFALDPMRVLIEDWAGHAQRMLSQFRLDAAGVSDDPRFADLVTDLVARSDEFRLWWPRHDVEGRLDLHKRVSPPGSGMTIGFVQSTWALSTSPGLRLVVYAPDGPASAALVHECIAAHAR